MTGMSAVAVERGVFLTRVKANEPLCREHFRLVLEVEDFPEAAPGQFLQVLCADPQSELGRGAAFVRRPFSIGGLRRQGRLCEVDVMHRAVGPGTRWLAARQPGDAVSILGPLGRPFRFDEERSLAILVGGGIGLPPLIWLAEALHARGQETLVFVGARSAEWIPLTRVADVPVAADEASPAFAEFARAHAPVVVATNDGSLGSTGYVPDTLARYLDRHPELAARAVIYTCGPEPMMRAAAEIAEARGIPCQVCLERVMACGMGTCQSCVVAVRDAAAVDGWRYRLCCTDGPVFDSREVIWPNGH